MNPLPISSGFTFDGSFPMLMPDAPDEINAACRLFLAVANGSPELSDCPPPAADASLEHVWSLLCQRFGCTSPELAGRIAKLAGLPLLPPSPKDVDLSLARAVPRALATAHVFIPVREVDGHMVLAVANPYDPAVNANVQFITGLSCQMEQATPEQVQLLQSQAYDDRPSRLGQMNLAETGDINDRMQERELPKLARQLLIKALNQNASDIHMQPFGTNTIVRMRVDGVLQRMAMLPASVGAAIIRFFKAQGAMDPTNQLIPQDGRMVLHYAGNSYDLRLSVLPVSERAEKLVIRILNRHSVQTLSGTGFALDNIHHLRQLLGLPSGLILMCGPTGSGKTTTLYAMLQEINREDISITTVENPVEYHMTGLSQTEVNDKAGLSFAAALRSILRQDPDVILVGEIRDKETAEIALQSALTGHLVLSTLHTNDSIGAIPRLLDLGVSPTILAEALAGVVSQRLVRRLCEQCRAPTTAPLQPHEQFFLAATHVQQPFRAVGCEHCRFTGYHGRQAVLEMFEPDNALKTAITQGVTEIGKLQAIARGRMVTLAMAASRLVISGITTASEVARTLGNGFWARVAQEYGQSPPDIMAIDAPAEIRSEGQRMGVLLAGERSSFSGELVDAIETSWLACHFAGDPDTAGAVLRKEENIRMVVLDLPASGNIESQVATVAAWRVAMAWTRLPALVRLPAAPEGLAEALRANGATSRFLPLQATAGEVLAVIHQAIAQQMDFTWGLTNPPQAAQPE